MLRKPARAAMLAFVVVLVTASVVVVAGGATADPIFKVPGDSAGNPLPATLIAQGFAPGSQVFIEQCDGVSPSAVGWDVSVDCDPGDTTPPLLADAQGVARFTAGGSHAFTPFAGESPSSLFNCLAPNQASPANGLTDFRNCKVRIASNNSDAPANQKFMNIQLPDPTNVVDPKFASGLQIAPSVNPAGSCEGGESLVKAGTATAGAGLTDQTQDVTLAAALLKDVHTSPAVILGGTCSGLVNSHYAGTNTATGAPTALGTLHEVSASMKLTGASSCAWNTASLGADAQAANAYTLSGTLSLKFSETFTSTTGPKPYTLSATLALKHDPAFSDVWDVSGRVTKGPSVGANVSGSVYLDPVAKFAGTAVNVTSNIGPVPMIKPVGYTGYGLDASVTSAFAGCSDGVAGNTHSAAVANPVTTRTDTGTVVAGAQGKVTDSSVTFTDQGDPVTGSGIPTNSFVGTVTSGTSFLLSASPTSQVDVNVATGGANKPIKITTDPARNIPAQAGIPLLQLGDGVSPLGNPTTGLVFSF